MIERKIIQEKFTQFKVATFIKQELPDLAIKQIEFEKTPLGERVTIYTSTPGLVIGREGSNIKKLTESLRKKFKFENPQIKIGEVKERDLSASIVARNMANDLTNFGSQKFKLTGFKAIMNIMNAGAMGVEIRISGKIPSSRAKSWRFSKGYIKKTGYVSDYFVDHAIDSATLKTGKIGIKVSIMLPGTVLPDKIILLENLPKVEALDKAIAEKRQIEADE